MLGGTRPREGATRERGHLSCQTAFSQALGNRTLLRKIGKVHGLAPRSVKFIF